MKKVSLFSKAMQAKKQEQGNETENQQSNGFPQAVKLTSEQLITKKEEIPQPQQQKQQTVKIEEENTFDHKKYEQKTIQKANAHKLSVEEFRKIEQSNIQQLQTMDQEKIQQMQEELKALLGENLVEMFRKGQIYEEKEKNQMDKIEYFYKDRTNEKKMEEEMQPEEIFQGKEQLPYNIPKEFLKNNAMSERIKIERVIGEFQIKLQGSYPSVQNKTTCLNDLKTIFSNMQNKGSVVEFFELFTEIIDFFVKQITVTGQITLKNEFIFFIEVVEFIERNFQFSQFILINFQKVYLNINIRILEILEKWFSLLFPFQWSKLYSKFSLEKSQEEIFKKYAQLLKESKIIENLKQLLNSIALPHQLKQLLNIIRCISIVFLGSSESKIDTILGTLQQRILAQNKIDLSDFTALLILNPQPNLLQQHYVSKINVDPMTCHFSQFLDQFNRFYRKEVDIYQLLMNVIVSQFSSYLNQNTYKFDQNLQAIIQTTFLLNDKSNLTQFKKRFQFTQPQLTLTNEELFEKILRLNDIDAPCIFAIFIQKEVKSFSLMFKKLEMWSYMNANLPELDERFLENFTYKLISFKFWTKQIVDSKRRRNICRQFFDQLREQVADDLLESAKIREQIKLSEKSSKFYVYLQIIADLMEVVFYKNDQSNQIHYFIDSPAYGLYQLLYFKKSKAQQDDFYQINKFMGTFSDNFGKINYEYLFLKFIKFLLLENNDYLQIEESSLQNFIKHLIYQLDFQKLAMVLNINVSYFEKFLKKFIFDSYDSSILTTIAFCFIHPLMKTEISNLVLDEFKNRKNLSLISFEIPEHFYDFSQTPEGVGKSIYLKNVEQLQEKGVECKLLSSWIKRVIGKIN